MPLTKPSGQSEWISLAETRIQNVPRTRIAATIRQLEVKISESGPAHLRPEPHNLKNALDNLRRSGTVRQIKPRGERRHEEAIFYTLQDSYPQPANTRVQELLVPYRTHRMLTDNEDYCSKHLEDIVQASFHAVPDYTYKGRLPEDAPLDGVYRHGSYLLGVEVKNVREWVYPMSGRIWVMLRKCLEIDALPFFVTRKMPYITRSVFSRLGILGFEVYRQVFSPSVAHLLTDIQHTDRLGYKDVIALPPAPLPPLVVYLQNTFRAQIAVYHKQWKRQSDLLAEFVIDRNLGHPDMRDTERGQHYDDFANAVFYEENGEEREPDIDPFDYY